MSGFKGIAQNGWHPKGKDGQGESWRKDFKGINQVAGWMGKGKETNTQASDHVSRPLSTLKDPAAFGPPPKNVNYHGGAAITSRTTPDTRGWGAPMPKEQLEAELQAADKEAERAAEEIAKPNPPPVPFRANTTGLSTSHLPLPPGRQDGADCRTPPTDRPKPPGLPPRLPPRQSSIISAPWSPPAYNATVSEPETHKGTLNQASLSRIGAAGISVGGLGIGGSKDPRGPGDASHHQASLNHTTVQSSQLNQLQSRLSRLNPPSKPETPSQGTTSAQKLAALKTASSFRNDPSSVSMSDAKMAASTANNFRARHGEQVKSGLQSANKLNNKYGIADKFGRHGGTNPLESPQPDMASPNESNTSSVTPLPAGGKKKPAPPPPMKKAQLARPSTSNDAPPPIPLSSKPNPQNTVCPERIDLDLDLSSLWFTKSPPAFPPRRLGLGDKISHTSSSGWSLNGVRRTHTFNAIDASNPALTVKAQQKHFPPPQQLRRHDLDACRDMYSEAIASWCESNMGQMVGDGECWTLAHHALQAVATQSQEPCMVSQSLIHGHMIYLFVPALSTSPKPIGGILEAGVARGDIVQLLTAHFRDKDGSQKWAGAPDHTAVVTGVDTNGVLGVLEQNVGNVKMVQTGQYKMSDLAKGEVRIFRAVKESWLGPLDPTW